ncbi:MAG TPA: TatD family hydrolase [Acidimicrobiales bacterium]
MPWTDTHCHLPFDGIDDVDAVVGAARDAGVTRMVTVGTDGEHSRATVETARRHDGMWAAVGLHPHDAKNGVGTILPVVDDGVADGTVVAVGECGLDYHYDHSPRDVQREVFAAQVRLAHERGLALVIHTREAWDDTWAILRAEGVPARTVFHCFTGGAEEARTSLDLGAYLSFSGIVTFKTADDVREAARLCPSDRLVVETDAPFLTPVPHRGRTNTPAFVPLVGAAVAEVRGDAVDRVEEVTWANATALFGLPN